MASTPPLTPHDRDAALQRLRDWRTSIALGSAGAVVAFATVAAVTIPGQQAAAATQGATTTQDDGTQQPADPNAGGGFQAPQQLPGRGFGGGQAVSGGSH